MPWESRLTSCSVNKVFRVRVLSFSVLAGVAGVAKLTSVLGRSSRLSAVLSSAEPGVRLELGPPGVSIWDCQAWVRSQPRLSAISRPLSGGEQEVSSRGVVQAVREGDTFSGETQGLMAWGGSGLGDFGLFL